MVPDSGNRPSWYKHITTNGSLQKPWSRQTEGNTGTSSCNNFPWVTQQSPGKARVS